MNKIATICSILALVAAGAVQAETTRDCRLEGTVYKSDRQGQAGTNVKFHSVKKYDEDANCRVRRGEKLDFKLPDDPRLEAAPDGSSVIYRYQEHKDGSTETQLLSVGA